MKHTTSQQHYVDFLAVLTLFGIFAIAGIVLIIFGSRIYRNIITDMNTNADTRTAAAYITQKVRQNETAGAVRAGEFDGHSALIMQQEINNSTYVTYLYENKGHLCELFCEEDAGLAADAGTEILAVQSAVFAQKGDNAVQVTLTTESGDTQEFTLHVLPASEDDLQAAQGEGTAPHQQEAVQ